MSPPCCTIIPFAIANPNPAPPVFEERAASSYLKEGGKGMNPIYDHLL